MFERYTERARRVLFFARYEASQFGSLSIETEHLLLGLLREGKGITSRIFARSHVSLEEIRRAIESRTVVREHQVATSVEIPFSAETKRVLQAVAQEADRLLHNYIGTEHLLLGILSEERSVAGSILVERGMRLDLVREHIVELLNDKTTMAPLRDGDRPAFPPSYEVHISPARESGAGISSTSARDHWTALGFDLKAIIARVYGVDQSRIDLPSDLDIRERYDFAVVLPKEETPETIDRLVQEAIAKQFGLVMTHETRSVEAYVLTAPGGAGPGLHVLPETGGGGTVTWATADIEPTRSDDDARPVTDVAHIFTGASIQNISASGCTISRLCLVLEEALDRLFVDETHLEGRYDFEVRSDGQTTEDFLQALRDQLGLVVTPGRRDVSMLVVRRR
jgi:uncharacterized protein (TIGR03435 family)